MTITSPSVTARGAARGVTREESKVLTATLVGTTIE